MVSVFLAARKREKKHLIMNFECHFPSHVVSKFRLPYSTKRNLGYLIPPPQKKKKKKKEKERKRKKENPHYVHFMKLSKFISWFISFSSCFSALDLRTRVSLSFFFSSSSEIPQFRLPFGVVDFEIEQMKDLDVKVHCQYRDVLFHCAAVSEE